MPLEQPRRAAPLVAQAAAPAVDRPAATVADGTYPLSRKLFLYYSSAAPQRVSDFVNWALTPEAQALVSDVGYFPLQ